VNFKFNSKGPEKPKRKKKITKQFKFFNFLYIHKSIGQLWDMWNIL